MNEEGALRVVHDETVARSPIRCRNALISTPFPLVNAARAPNVSSTLFSKSRSATE